MEAGVEVKRLEAHIVIIIIINNIIILMDMMITGVEVRRWEAHAGLRLGGACPSLLQDYRLR